MSRWFYCFFWFLLLLSVFFCAPIPYQKQLFNILDENVGVDQCLFDEFDKELPKMYPDESKSKVLCGGRMFSLRKILEHIKPDRLHPLYGAKNVIDLMLSRMGTFDTKWDGDEENVLNFFICEQHFKELFWNWEDFHSKIMKVKSDKKQACNWPQEMGQHDDKRLVRYRISKEDAEIIFRAKTKYVHPGTGICDEHQKELFGMIETVEQEKIDPEFCVTDPVDVEMDVGGVQKVNPKDAAAYAYVQDFADNFDIKRFVSTCKYNSMQADSKRKKVNSAKFLFFKIAEAVAPNEETFFLDQVCSKFENPNADQWKYQLIQNVVEQYSKAVDDKILRLYALSTITPLVSYGEILAHLPNLTYYYFREAQKLKKAETLPKPDEKKIYIRYDAHKIENFLDFVTSPFCLIALPYGQKKVTLSDGSKLDIPHTMRLQRNADIIRMFKAKMNDEGKADLILPDSSMYGILKQCYAKPAKAMQCVDYFIAAGLEAFDTLKEIIDQWNTQQLLDAEMVTDLKKRLDRGQQYLKTDFKVNLKMHSPVVNLDLTVALSDPNDDDFRQDCAAPGEHVTLCERSEALRNLLTEITEYAEQFFEDAQESGGDANEIEEKKRTLFQINEAVMDIEEMKSHIVRSRFSDIQRTQIIENLDDESVLITLDFAQKLLAQRRYETQKTYFGKKGMSYHVAHVLGKVNGKLVDHSYIHILKGTKQDNNAVAAILLDVLHNVSKMGINSALVRADNADKSYSKFKKSNSSFSGCYHATQLMFSLQKMSEVTGVKIVRFSFSEAQNGKSSCDQKASHVKSKVRNYVIQHNKVETEEEFLQAVTSPPMHHTTFALSTVQKPEKSSEIKSLPGISSFSEFIMEENGIRVYKFYQIGTGKLFPYSKYKPIKQLPYLKHKSKNNILDESTTINKNSEKEAITNGEETSYWRTVKGTKGRNSAQKFLCPENQCIESFDTMADLEHHLEVQNHTFRQERMTAADYAVTYFYENVRAVGAEYEDTSEDIIRNNVMRDLWSPDIDQIKQGWAHKKHREFPKNTAKTKMFLQKIFDEGEKSGVKTSPQQALKQMSSAKKDGHFLFKAEEVLKLGQVRSYFSFLTKEKKKCENSEPPKKKQCPLPDTENDNYNEEEEEEDNDDPEIDEERPLRRSRRLVNIENAHLREIHDDSINSMVFDAINPHDEN